MQPAALVTQLAELPDERLVELVLAGESAAFEPLMRRHNQRLYRIARAILRDDSEAEDVMQDAYVRAYQHLDQFAGRAKFSTWLSRIAVHEAFARLRRRRRFEEFDAMDEKSNYQPVQPAYQSPERAASNAELNLVLERAIAALPEKYRTVFVLREVEELSTEETAQCLELTPQNVKVRLHRAKSVLKRELLARMEPEVSALYPFPATRCDRVVAAVMARIAARLCPTFNV